MQDPNVNLGEVVRFLMRGLVYAVPLAALLAIGTYLFSQRLEPVYEASTTLLAVEPASGSATLSPPALNASAYRTVVLSDPVLSEALLELGYDMVDQATIRSLRSDMDVSTESFRQGDPVLIYVTFASPSPELAAATANAVAESLVRWDRNRASANIEQRITTLEQQLGALEESITNLRLQGGVANQNEIDRRISLQAQQQEELFYARALRNSTTGLLSVVQPAPVPLEPVAPRPLLNAALAVVFGVFLLYGILLLRNLLDTRLHNAGDIGVFTGLPVLAEFPKSNGRHLSKEVMGYLRTNLLFGLKDDPSCVILVTSPSGAEGKSSVALSLAESFVHSGSKTLLVEADLRRPVLAREYRLSTKNSLPLEEHLKFPREEGLAQITLSSGQPLDLVPTFQPTASATELLSRGFHNAIETWQPHYEVIVVDSAPLLPVADTLTIAPFCTGTVLVVSLKTTNRRELRASVERLQRIGTRILGVVVTHGQASASSYELNKPAVPTVRERVH